MQLIIIRHLQTEWNRQGLLQGRNDINVLPIDEELQKQIEQQRQQLIDLNDFDCVLVSELKRTHQTAKAYGYSEFSVEPLINELNFGQFEGRPRQELISNIGQEWFDDPRQVVLGESIDDLNKRIIHFLIKYQDSHRLLIFAHGSWSRAMISFIECGDLRKMNQVQVLNNQLIQLSYHSVEANQFIVEQAN